MEPFRIFALPYAGGLSSTYFQLKQELKAKNIELIALEYSGHGSRMGQPLYTSIKDIAQDIYQQIEQYNLKKSYAILGYSMGCLVAYELYYLLLAHHIEMPAKMLLCSMALPAVSRHEPDFAVVSDNELIKKLKEWGGTCNTLFQDSELLSIFLPQIRADLIANATYITIDCPARIEAEGIIIYGTDEFPNLTKLRRWDQVMEHSCFYYGIKGGHFFLQDRYKELGELIYDSIHLNANV